MSSLSLSLYTTVFLLSWACVCHHYHDSYHILIITCICTYIYIYTHVSVCVYIYYTYVCRCVYLQKKCRNNSYNTLLLVFPLILELQYFLWSSSLFLFLTNMSSISILTHIHTYGEWLRNPAPVVPGSWTRSSQNRLQWRRELYIPWHICIDTWRYMYIDMLSYQNIMYMCIYICIHIYTYMCV